MTLEEVLALRPKDASAAAIRAALETANTTAEALRQQALRLDAKRASSLLDADDAELIAAEEAATRNRLAADRIAALVTLMEGELKAAVAREAADRFHAAVLEVNQQAERFMAAWRKEYPKAAEAIARLLRMEEAHEEALEQLCSIAHAAEQDGAAPRADTPQLTDVKVQLFGTGHFSIRDVIQLPSADGRLRASPYWEPKKLVTGQTMADDVAFARSRPLQVVSSAPVPAEPEWTPGLARVERYGHPGMDREAG